jgi:hypothetical protein
LNHTATKADVDNIIAERRAGNARTRAGLSLSMNQIRSEAGTEIGQFKNEVTTEISKFRNEATLVGLLK